MSLEIIHFVSLLKIKKTIKTATEKGKSLKLQSNATISWTINLWIGAQHTEYEPLCVYIMDAVGYAEKSGIAMNLLQDRLVHNCNIDKWQTYRIVTRSIV